MTARPQATYLFCLAQSRQAPTLRGAPDSVPGAGAVRALLISGDIWAIVADAPLDRFSGEALQRDLQDVEAISRHALAHAAVVEFVFRRSPVIPIKLFTLFSSDEKARADLRPRSARLRRLFAELQGREEWGVRIVVNEPEAQSAAASSGRDYLVTKRKQYERSGKPRRALVRETAGALRQLGALAVKVRKDAFPPASRGRPFVSGASFLVSAKRRRRWDREVAKLTVMLAEHGSRLEVSGPWPPYHFVSK